MHTLWPSNSIPSATTHAHAVHRVTCTNVHSSTISNSEKNLAMIQMARLAVFSSQNTAEQSTETSTTMHNNTDTSRKHTVEKKSAYPSRYYSVVLLIKSSKPGKTNLTS